MRTTTPWRMTTHATLAHADAAHIAQSGRRSDSQTGGQVADQIAGSRSLRESRVVSLRCRLAVVQCARLRGQERQGTR